LFVLIAKGNYSSPINFPNARFNLLLARKKFSYPIGLGGGCEDVRAIGFTYEDLLYRSDSDLMFYDLVGGVV